MKINEVIAEALNTNTGTPNADVEQGWDQDTYTGHVNPKTVQMPDFSGLKQASQGAKALGRGIARGAQAAGRFAQSFVPGTAANQMRQAEKDAKPQIQANKENVQIALAQWQKYIQDRGATTDFKNPGTYKHELQQWANARFPSSANAISINTVNPQQPNTIIKYISDMYSTAMANRAVNKTTGNTTNVATEVLNKLITKAEAEGNRIGLSDVSSELSTLDITPIDRRELAMQIIDKLKGYGIEIATGPHGVGAGEAPTLSPGVSVVSSDPIVLGYDKRKYALNSQNRWVMFGSSRPASDEMARFLNKQMQAL